MFNRVIGIYRTYATRHAGAVFGGFAILDEAGDALGYVDRMSLRGERLRIEGWTLGEEVGVSRDGQAWRKVPDLERRDVPCPADRATARFTPGFSLEIPFPHGGAQFWVRSGGLRFLHPLGLPPGALQRARRATLPGFLRAGLRAFPDALRWHFRGDEEARARAKASLGYLRDDSVGQLTPELFQPSETPRAGARARRDATPITIVLPVYNAFDLLPEVLDRLRRHTDLPWRLIAVEDCSSDPAVRPWLRSWRAGLCDDERARVTLLENAENRGFIGSVNRAFEAALDIGNHVVLLNSDAFVPAGWASRLMEPLLDDANVASVTPMSNDAEIFTAPVICRRNVLEPGEADRIDALAARLGPGDANADAPTGVGFCMAINIAFLRHAPKLDQIFGRGYGEEVDWCQKAREAGGMHVCATNLFVEHRGGASFGSAEKQKLVRANNAIVASRYPRYDGEVQAFIAADPLRSARLALGLAWAGLRQQGRIPVYVAHSLGGGAEHYLENRIRGDLARGGTAVVLRLGGVMRWQIELRTPQGATRAATDDWALARQLLDLLGPRRIIYSCAVGDRDPVTLPDRMLEIAGRAGDALEVLFHDYFPVSPSYTLLGEDGRYVGVPRPEAASLAHATTDASGAVVTPGQWRAAWGRLTDAAEALVVFSENSRGLVAEAFPDAAAKIACRPHELHSPVARITPRRGADGRPVIGVLGNIGAAKGAAVVAALSETLERTRAGRLVVLGNLDPAFRVAPGGGVIHGDYQVKDLAAHVGHYGISAWLIPSIWPETFSYTTHEALATGLPVWSFDLGAQGDAVAAAASLRGIGGTLPLAMASGDPQELVDAMLGTVCKVSA